MVQEKEFCLILRHPLDAGSPLSPHFEVIRIETIHYLAAINGHSIYRDRSQE
jgi:hypothetical protein